MLSSRLQIMYDCVLPDQPLWDIGCDHGNLGLWAHAVGSCSEVHLVDRSADVVDELRRQVAKRWPDGPGEGLQLWHQDAENQDLPITTGTVVIAGVGVWTILGIIARVFSGRVPAGVRLVLASLLKEDVLREHLRRQGWHLQREELYPEAGRVRQLLVWESTGESANPFWNGSALSHEHGLLEQYLAECRQYFSVSQSTDPDLVYLKAALGERFAE